MLNNMNAQYGVKHVDNVAVRVSGEALKVGWPWEGRVKFNPNCQVFFPLEMIMPNAALQNFRKKLEILVGKHTKNGYLQCILCKTW